MTEKKTTTTAQKQPDGIITTQRNGQTIVAELFFNHRSAETFRDKLLKAILADYSHFLRLTVKSRKNGIFDDWNTLDEECIARAFSIEKTPFFPSQEPKKTPEKCPYCVTGAQKGEFMKTGLKKQEKTTDIWFDEKDPLIHIRTHNTDLKNRLTAYSRRFPSVCKLTDSDPETGCMEFEIAKGRFSFRLTAPYSEERRQAASDYAKKHGISAGKSKP